MFDQKPFPSHNDEGSFEYVEKGRNYGATLQSSMRSKRCTNTFDILTLGRVEICNCAKPDFRVQMLREIDM